MKMVLPDPPLITDYEDMYLLVVKAILTSQNKTNKKKVTLVNSKIKRKYVIRIYWYHNKSFFRDWNKIHIGDFCIRSVCILQKVTFWASIQSYPFNWVNWVKRIRLTQLLPVVSFYNTPWKHQKTSGFWWSQGV